MPAEPIDPVGVTWTRVEPKYITVKLITGVLGWLILLLLITTPVVLSWIGVFNDFPWWVEIPVLGGMLIWAIIDIALVPRRIRAIGYHEREDDLLIRKGILWQRVVAVPYGRLQYVDIEAGPVMRKFKLCTVQLKTASAETDAIIPGVSREEGARLREELSTRGQARLAGL